MILFVNARNEIKDVETTNKVGLTPIEVNDKTNPFMGWSKAKICCYRVTVLDGNVVGFTPYIDTRIMEQLDNVGQAEESVAGGLSSNWMPNTLYKEGQYVMYSNVLYKCLAQNSNITPPDRIYWSEVNIAEELNNIMNMIKEIKG